ncbi:riboflavin synthase [bacterium]|nr:riboflavin synthase [candidate division CSSED10-310 bacterium]
MFTGIIREVGRIETVKKGTPWKLTIEAPGLSPSLRRGDSICVSGACLTVTDTTIRSFDVDVTAETLARTTLTAARSGMPVNLEPAVKAQSGLDGHIVQGHVDTTGRIIKISGRTVKDIIIRPETASSSLILEKGSITVNGISLTVSQIRPGGEFSVSVIPVTLSETNLGRCHAGDTVNLEYDIIGKYVDAWLRAGSWRLKG